MSSVLDNLINSNWLGDSLKAHESIAGKGVAVIGEVYRSVIAPAGEIIEGTIEGYHTAQAEWNALKKYIGGLENVTKDPQMLLYILDTLLRENPVKIPKGVDPSIRPKKDIEELFDDRATIEPLPDGRGRPRAHPRRRKIPTGVDSDIMPGHTQYYFDELEFKKDKVVRLPEVSSADRDLIRSLFRKGLKGATRINPLEWLGKAGDRNKSSEQVEGEIVPLDGSSAYRAIHDPYDGVTSISTLSDLKKYLADGGFNFGYKRWAGFEIGTDHLWDIKMKPFHYAEGVESVFGEFPIYEIPRVGDNGEVYAGTFDFGEYLPAIAYTLNFGSQIMKSIPLFNGSNMQMPIGFAYDVVMTLEIVDDVYHSMKNYIVQSLNSIYNIEDNEVTPFQQAAWEIDLTIYRSGFEKSYRAKLIGCPINYHLSYEGQNDPNGSQVHLELGIVGIRRPNRVETVIGKNLWESKTKWTEVILNPGGGIRYHDYKSSKSVTLDEGDGEGEGDPDVPFQNEEVRKIDVT